jgi:hypothetical protein
LTILTKIDIILIPPNIVGWKIFSSFGCESVVCAVGQPNVLKFAVAKRKLKMRVGKI